MMRRIIATSILLSTIGVLFVAYYFQVHKCAQSQHAAIREYTLSVNETTRRYILYAPHPTSDSLVLVFHAGGGPLGSAEAMAQYSGWTEIADRECIAIAFMVGTRERLELPIQTDNSKPLYNPIVWNTGADTGASTRGEPDIDYSRLVIEDIRSRINIRSSNTYATGFSNGGTFIYTLTLALPKLFTAIAPIEAAAPPGKVHLKAPVSLLSISNVPLGTTKIERGIAEAWGQSISCKKEAKESIATIHRRVWTRCSGGAQVQEILIEDIGHIYPGLARLFEPNADFRTSIYATQEAWNFFKSL